MENLFRLNRNGHTAEEIFGKPTDELVKITMEDLYADIPFALFIYRATTVKADLMAPVSIILGVLIGRRLEEREDMVEYLVNSVRDRGDREIVIRALSFITDKEDMMKILKREEEQC